ncbi:right-handed parallel beta-helix repeat-containing protein [Argonema antarcticum]|uniref:right-handed parallel beta-helix repeat-containing protein n=1 Tax=Argonema antarcticum TaxID=2942763 RepID=UPI002012291B|nr:right-handed parallel beta-helix repeat-containing protein [Argonema antarcticum]MCL1473353.1 right-handed parallel beta-helix repeat-containing protein [Argonema antarcticum A004/B2]
MDFFTGTSRRSFIFGLFAFLASESIIAQMEEIVVSTVEEFVAAIGPNRTIKLKPGAYSLSDLDPAASSRYAYFEKAFDGNELIISGVENLQIIGLGIKPPLLLTRPRYGDVLKFRDCQDITIKNIEAGHGPEKGFCRGGVFTFDDSENIQVNSCILFGSGILGIRANNVNNLTCSNTVIKECTYHILSLFNCQNIAFRQCQFNNNKEYELVNVLNSRNVQFLQCGFRNNSIRVDYDFFFNVKDSEPVKLQRCTIENNNVPYFASSPSLVNLIETDLESNTFRKGSAYPPNS